MQKQEISNIIIFFVTQDLKGQPRGLEIHLIPEKEVSMANQRFTEYLHRQREMYKPSLVQSYLPDLDLCRYQFPPGVSYPDIRLFDKDNSQVRKFIAENGGSMQGNVSLRGLEYLYHRDEEKSLPMLVSSGLANHLLVQPEAKRFALAQDTLNDDPSETLTAVETDKGVLLFEYSGFGKTCCHSFMQHLADRFFITGEEKPEFVNLYKLTRPDAEVVKAFQTSPNAFSLYTNSFLPDKAQYLDATILRNARLNKSHRMEPTLDAYDKFASSYGVVPTIANAQILRLLSLQETAGIYGIDYTTRRIPFMHKNSFNSQFSALQNIPAENKGEQEKVKALIRDQAAYILKRDYGISPDNRQNKEIAPIISIQTPKGAVYLPVTDEGVLYKQCFLQDLADRFFTPEVQSLGRIREFYISNPNHSTEHYMQKHLDFFRSNPSDKQLANIPLYPIEQSELLKKGGYPTEPAYHAFKQFTEDNRLSVNSKNAGIFTLLFIREYGLPADFNTNESYKEFTHKGDFKPLEKEMSELQSQKGYSEKTFYHIQNRQQQLADKILGLEYKLTCPPLQLTGEKASEKKKAAPHRNKSHNPRI
ncbi:DUF6047 family protein [Bacteroides intestinalis]|uniref:DUF6047 family protein n=1 Tax=Bacteroides intestinalis TaxID=329854 RepID=UPI00189E804B|nr:DUF6047 family protein [Bacteroides intestinalis]